MRQLVVALLVLQKNSSSALCASADRVCVQTHHIICSNEVLEGEGGSESRLGGYGVGVDDVEETERVLGLGSLLLESRLGCW